LLHLYHIADFAMFTIFCRSLEEIFEITCETYLNVSEDMTFFLI